MLDEQDFPIGEVPVVDHRHIVQKEWRETGYEGLGKGQELLVLQHQLMMGEGVQLQLERILQYLQCNDHLEWYSNNDITYSVGDQDQCTSHLRHGYPRSRAV